MNTGGDHLDPGRLETADFPVVRRGFDQELVRTQMLIAASEIRRLRGLVGELEREISMLESRPVEVTEAQIAEALGEEAAQVLDAARLAAAERAERAEREAAELMATAENEAAAATTAAEHQRDRILEDAASRAQQLEEEGRERGREMVAEARSVRERMLQDLARKRQMHRAEVEQLRAGRDRLLESLGGTQRELDQWTSELIAAVPEAQAAAEKAGLRVNSEPEMTVDQLEAEIAAARLVGHPLVDGGAPDDRGSVEVDDTDSDAFLEPAPDGTAHADRRDEADDTAAIDGRDEADDTAAADRRDEADDTDPADQRHEADGTAAADQRDEADGTADADRRDEADDPARVEPRLDEDTDEWALPDVPALDGRDRPDEPTQVFDIEREGLDADERAASEADVDEQAVPEAEVEDLFARLRSSQESGSEPNDESDLDTTHAEAAAETEADLDIEPGPTAEADDDDDESDVVIDLIAAAREDAIDQLARSLKRVVVDEQGDLLDGIRRDGADAVRAVMGSDARYVEAMSEPLRNLLLAVAREDIDLGQVTEGAQTSVRSLLVEPVRAKLEVALGDTDDPDELSVAVRAVYRECRSRRVDEAAGAAVAAVYTLARESRSHSSA